MKYTDYIYDIECLPNFFSIVIKRQEDYATWRFIVAPWLNEGVELNLMLNRIKLSGGRMVGFNNLGYDYPMLHLIMQHSGRVNNIVLYNKSISIINADWNDRSHRIWDSETLIPQLDLRAMHHMDSREKSISLKLLEFNMRMDSIEELELDFNEPIKREDEATVLDYNDHDVDASILLYNYSKKEIAFRDELSAKHNKSFTNFNDTKIGQEIFVMQLAKHGIRATKWNQTIRDEINVGEILLPYIQFETSQFNEVLRFFKGTIIDPYEIKGFFGSRDKSKSKCRAKINNELARVMLNTDVTVNYHDGSKSTYKDIDQTKSIDFIRPTNIHCIVNGFRFDFGAGGIHGSLHNTLVTPCRGETLRDVDVASYYPNIAIQNKLYPLHLSEKFCTIYKELYELRKSYPKKSSESGMIKLALNGVYGKSNDIHSPFYDPQYTMAITINGQLLLCMLAEQLMKIQGLKMVQINTDGLTYLCPNDQLEHANKINEGWESLTKLELEHVDYSKMAVQNVNNYLAVTKPYLKDSKLTPPKVKRIGSYAHERASENPGTRELPWHKDHSAVVVAKAAEAALVRGENIESFIRKHIKIDPMDFMLRTKVNRNDKLVLETPMMWGKDVVSTKVGVTQRVSRYFVSNRGGYLIKISEPTALQCSTWLTKPHWRHKVTGDHKMSIRAPSGMWVQFDPPTDKPPLRRTGISAGFKVTICNQIVDLDLSDINIDYYVKQTRKIVDPLIS
ncbi:MAG: hypothetical protein GY928_01100 [Colwellia sp.]|nr:hypothetical protein [Colwellia sp.]